MASRLSWLVLMVAFAVQAQDFSGRWVYTEGDQKAELQIEQDRATGRVTGSLTLFGITLPVEGRSRAGMLTIETMAGVSMRDEGKAVTGSLQQRILALRIVQPGEPEVTMPMKRDGVSTVDAPAPPATAARGEGFAGVWQASNDDNTQMEEVQLQVSGTKVTGTIRAAERGYISGRVTEVRSVQLAGEQRGNRVDLRAWDANGTQADATSGSAELRGEYLVIRAGASESVYARPGALLVKSAEGSADAAALAKAVTGRVYRNSSQASGSGAFVGSRTQLELCRDGSIAYESGTVATTGNMPQGGVDMGNTIHRRGQWTIVLRGGRPVVRAQWQGTGTSYSLIDYFDIVPAENGRTAVINGRELPVSGGC